MASSRDRLVAILRPVAEAIRPPADVRRAQRVERAITDDGRPRLDRATGAIPAHALIATAAESVRADPTDTSSGATVQDQLQDQAEDIVDLALDLDGKVNDTGDTMTGPLIAPIQDKGGAVFNAEAYGAVGDGTTNDTTAAQAAIDAAAAAAGGGIALFGPGIFDCTTLTNYAKVTIRGSGIGATTIRLRNGTNAALIQSDGFAALTGTNSAGGIGDWAIEDLTLDGNKANNATTGYGVRVYGYRFTIRNVLIKNCDTNGWYSEWHTGFTLPAGNLMEAKIDGLFIDSSGADGFVWAGPHDSQIANVIVANSVGKGIWVKAGNGSIFTSCHSWGATQTYAWYVEADGTQCANCVGEGASAAQVFWNADYFQWDGYVYAAGAAVPVGFEIGTGSPAVSRINATIAGCTSGAFKWGVSTGYHRLSGIIYQTSGTVHVGTPPDTRDETGLLVEGIAHQNRSTMPFEHAGQVIFDAPIDNQMLVLGYGAIRTGLWLQTMTAAQQAFLSFANESGLLWMVGKQWNETFVIYNNVTAEAAITVEADSDVVLSDGLSIGAGAKITKYLSATTTWDPPSLNTATQQTTTVTVTGAALGDTVDVSFSLDLQATALRGYVSATNTVTVVHRNDTGGTINLASGTLRASVTQH